MVHIGSGIPDRSGQKVDDDVRLINMKTIRRGATILALTGATLGAGATAGAADYPPTPSDPQLDVSAFAPICQSDVPYIQYSIVPIGFDSLGPATLTFTDRNGTVVSTVVVDDLSGQVIYPGASVDADGHGTDWPGWKYENGAWVPDSSDAILRNGLSIKVEVNPTATASVAYPGSDTPCADPPGQSVSDNASTPTGTLPQTGGPGTMTILLVAGGALAMGLAFTNVSSRRRNAELAR